MNVVDYDKRIKNAYEYLMEIYKQYGSIMLRDIETCSRKYKLNYAYQLRLTSLLRKKNVYIRDYETVNTRQKSEQKRPKALSTKNNKEIKENRIIEELLEAEPSLQSLISDAANANPVSKDDLAIFKFKCFKTDAIKKQITEAFTLSAILTGYRFAKRHNIPDIAGVIADSLYYLALISYDNFSDDDPKLLSDYISRTINRKLNYKYIKAKNGK